MTENPDDWLATLGAELDHATRADALANAAAALALALARLPEASVRRAWVVLGEAALRVEPDDLAVALLLRQVMDGLALATVAARGPDGVTLLGLRLPGGGWE